MAKVKKDDVQLDKIDQIDLAEAVIAKKYGLDFLKSGSSLVDEPPQIISVSPRLDMLLNGGITSSSWINIIGPAKFGKTVLALRMAAQAQKYGYFILYANVEHRLKAMNLNGTVGLDYRDPRKFKILESTAEETLNGEKYLGIIEDYLKNTYKVFCIIDSVSSFAHPRQMDNGTGTATMGGMGVLVSQFVNNICASVAKRGHIIVNIQQQYNNTSGWGKKRFSSGGTKVTYQGDCILEAKSKSELKNGDKIVGQEVEWICECSALGTFPMSKTNSYIRYGIGIDCELELVSMAKELGLLVGSTWLAYKDIKIQGIDNWAMKLKEDRELYDEMYKAVMSMYKESNNEV